MWHLSDVYKLCFLLVLNVLLCEAGEGSLQPETEPEPEEADLLVQYGLSGVIPEPESEPEYQGYQEQGYNGQYENYNHGQYGNYNHGQYSNYNHGGQKAPMSNPYWNYPYWNSYYQPGKLNLF